MTQKFVFALLSSLVLLFASVQDSIAQRRFDRLSFHFTDASVSPPYHRSYSIKINEKRVLRFTVTNYSETLHQEDIALSDVQWKSLVAKSKKLEKAKSKIARGATGTSQRRIVLFQGEKEVYNLQWDSLNEVSKDTEDFVQQLKGLIPNFEKKREAKEEVMLIPSRALSEEEMDEVHPFAEEQPEPEGGYEVFYKYVAKNLKYPKEAKTKNIQGKVFINFVVERDGSLTDIKVARGIGGGCDEEAARLISESPKWKPGKQRNKLARVKMSIPIEFKLD